MVIAGEEPWTGGKALGRCRVKTLQEVPGRPQGRRGGGVQACRWSPGLWGKLLEGRCLLVSIPHEGRAWRWTEIYV